MVDAYRAYDAAFGDMPHMVCYAVKANYRRWPCSGCWRGKAQEMSTSSRAENSTACSGPAAIRRGVVFSGVGKSATEIETALSHGISNFNCESEAELAELDAIAGREWGWWRGFRCA